MHPGGQTAAQVVKELIDNAFAGADAAAAVDALDHRDVPLAPGERTGGRLAAVIQQANDEQTAEAAADQR